MKLCKHDQYKIIDWIREPKYSTDQCLINVATVDRVNNNYLVKFTNCSKYPDWFYFDYKTISKSRRQPNGRGEVYAVDMSKRQPLEIIKKCEHSY